MVIRYGNTGNLRGISECKERKEKLAYNTRSSYTKNGQRRSDKHPPNPPGLRTGTYELCGQLWKSERKKKREFREENSARFRTRKNKKRPEVEYYGKIRKVEVILGRGKENQNYPKSTP
jgi:hypothetical protein